jgi:hypothetical protein
VVALAYVLVVLLADVAERVLDPRVGGAAPGGGDAPGAGSGVDARTVEVVA